MTEVQRLGFTLLSGNKSQSATSDNHNVNVIFVHGLRGHPRDTWSTKPPASSPDCDNSIIKQKNFKNFFGLKTSRGKAHHEAHIPARIFWPEAYLAHDLPDARIWTYGYNADVIGGVFQSNNKNSISQHGRDLAVKLEREIDNQDPILFVVHSLGGIITKDALHRSKETCARTRLIVFLGTPHRGSGYAGWGQIASNMASLALQDSNKKLLQTLEVNAEVLDNIHEEFKLALSTCNIQVHSFQEAQGISGMKGLDNKVVDDFSSKLDLARTQETIESIDANHMEMARCSSRNDARYRQIFGVLKRHIRVDLAKTRMDLAVTASEISVGSGANTAHELPTQPRPAADRTDPIEPAEIMKGGHIVPDSFSSDVVSLDFESSLDIVLSPSDKKCIQSLCTIDMSTVAARLDAPVEGTLTWLQRNPAFMTWCAATTPMLMYITGYPGCGKTTIASYVVRSMLQHSTPGPVVCCFFCSSRADQERSISCLFRTIIYQVVLRRPGLLRMVKGASDMRPTLFDSTDDLWRLFADIVRHERDLFMYVVVDAIDECDEWSQKVFVDSVLTLLTSELHNNVKFFVTSRPNSYAAREFGESHVPQTRLRLETAQEVIFRDVELVIHKRVQALVHRHTCSAELGMDLERVLAEKAEGTFLWVSLMLSFLEKRRLLSKSDVTKLKLLPPGLEALYRDFLNSIPAEDRDHAAILLRKLACSTRPLKCEEVSLLFDAIEGSVDDIRGLELNDASIQALLHPLVRISNGCVFLVHHSLREYLINDVCKSEDPDLSSYQIDSDREAYQLAKACMEYLTRESDSTDLDWSDDASPVSPRPSSSEVRECESFFAVEFDLEDADIFKDQVVLENESWEKAADRYKLLDYSAKSWAAHLTKCNPSDTAEMQDLVLLLCDPNLPYLSKWSQYLRATSQLFEDLPVMLDAAVVAAYFRLDTTLAGLIKQNDSSFQYGQALYWAARRGNLKCVQLLVKLFTGSSPLPHESCYMLCQSPLATAAQHGHLSCVKVILQSRVFEVNKADSYGRTALSYAAGGGYSAILAALLCEVQVDGNIADHSGSTPLHWAASANCIEGVSCLLKHPTIQPNYVDRTGRTALSWSAQEGHAGICRILLMDNRINADLADVHGFSPLLYAVQNGHLDFVRVLVRSGRVDLSSRDRSGRNSISWAAERRHEDSAMLRYLLKYSRAGADQPDQDGWAPLAWAMNPPGYPENVAVLIQSGHVDINRQDETGRTALSFAVTYGHMEILQILLKDKKIDVNLADGGGRTPLSYAAAKGSLEMVKLFLIHKKTDWSVADNRGYSPIVFAVQCGDLDVVRALAGQASRASHHAHGVSQLSAALYYAKRIGRNEIVQILENP